MGKYKQYEEYKESGVESTPEMPNHWIAGKVKYVTESLNSVRVPLSSEERGSKKGEYPYYGASGIIDYVDDYLFDEETILFGEDGANLISRSTPLAFLANGKYWVNNHAHILRTKDGVNDYWVMCFENMDVTAFISGSAQPKLTAEALGDLQIVYPPTIAERKEIANFLDHETAQIDTLIEKQQTLIQLLKEKRQAVISHAVTKGLNPEAPMRDSGVEWLGEVPEHWEITKVGWVLNYLSYGFTNPMPTSDEGPYMLTATDINFNEINFEQARKTTNDAYENFITSKSKPEQGDLLLTKDGTLGRVAVFNSTYKTCISQSIALLRPNKKYVLSYFMEAALASSKYQKKMIFDAGGTTIKHIYISILAKMNLALPDIDEQLEITNYLNSKIDKFDALILKAQQAIQLMQERRTALISAAVTGKIDVRGWVAPESR